MWERLICFINPVRNITGSSSCDEMHGGRCERVFTPAYLCSTCVVAICIGHVSVSVGERGILLLVLKFYSPTNEDSPRFPASPLPARPCSGFRRSARRISSNRSRRSEHRPSRVPHRARRSWDTSRPKAGTSGRLAGRRCRSSRRPTRLRCSRCVHV